MVACEQIGLCVAGGYKAFARFWMPPSPCGAVLYLHGIQSHGGWFLQSAQRLADAGFAVLLPDRRGSGENSTQRGHARSAARLLEDCCVCLQELRLRTGFERAQVIGVSWGGKLALALARHAPDRVARLALVAPGQFPVVDVSAAEKVKIALSALACPQRLFNIPLDEPELFTANPTRQRFIRDDPLRLQRVSAGFLLASRRLEGYAAGVSKSDRGWPLALFLAGHDRIIDNHATRAFVRRLRWPDRRIIEYPEAHHTLEFEPDPAPFLNDLVTWVRGETPALARESEPRLHEEL